MAIVQDGMGCPCPVFAPCVYSYLCGKTLTEIKPDIMDIPDRDVCSIAKQVLLWLFTFYLLFAMTVLQITDANGAAKAHGCRLHEASSSYL